MKTEKGIHVFIITFCHLFPPLLNVRTLSVIVFSVCCLRLYTCLVDRQGGSDWYWEGGIGDLSLSGLARREPRRRSRIGCERRG